MGMSSFPLTNSIIFQDGYCTTNQTYPTGPRRGHWGILEKGVAFDAGWKGGWRVVQWGRTSQLYPSYITHKLVIYSSWSCKAIWLTIRHHPDWRGNPAYPWLAWFVYHGLVDIYNRPRGRLVWPAWLIFLALPELDELEWLHIMTSLEWWHPYYVRYVWVNYNDLTATSL